MSPDWASRMPATPRIITESSPWTVPPSSSASSASVRVLMRPPSLVLAAGRVRVQLGQNVVRHVEALVGVDDDPAGRVEDQFEAALARHLLDRAPHQLDDLLRGARVLLRRAAVGSPHILHERLVV